jgi:hypothetical protein
MTFPALGGTTPIVTSNQRVPGTAVAWAIARRDDDNEVHLWAFDASDLSKRLISLKAGRWTNAGGNAFIEPTVIAGNVYVASENLLRAYNVPFEVKPV